MWGWGVQPQWDPTPSPYSPLPTPLLQLRPRRPSVQEQSDGLGERPVGLERVELGAARGRCRPAPGGGGGSCSGRPCGPRPARRPRRLALQPAELRPFAERKLHLVRVQHLDQDRFVPVVPQAGQALAELSDRDEQVRRYHHQRPSPEPVGDVLQRLPEPRRPGGTARSSTSITCESWPVPACGGSRARPPAPPAPARHFPSARASGTRATPRTRRVIELPRHDRCRGHAPGLAEAGRLIGRTRFTAVCHRPAGVDARVGSGGSSPRRIP